MKTTDEMRISDWSSDFCSSDLLEDGRSTYIQLLCTAGDNKALRDISSGALPIVEPGTVLLEGAYTPPRFRHLPIMPAAMARIAEEGRRRGARWAVVPKIGRASCRERVCQYV